MTPNIDEVEIKIGYSDAVDETMAAEQLARQLQQPDLSFAVFFVSSLFDLRRISNGLKSYFTCPLFGCTTAGEITPKGYLQHSLTGFSVGGGGLIAHPFLLQSLRDADTNNTARVIHELKERLQEIRMAKPERGTFGMLLIDGLSVMEEQVIAILADAVGNMPIVGGSAGDDLQFRRTCVFTNGTFFTDAALFIVFETILPFIPIKNQHFAASDNRLVITQASPENRLVQEINGRPAVQEYARIIGVDTQDLKPEIFSTYPVMLRLGGEYYVRSIRNANDDGSLAFYCAIDEGLVLRIASGENLVDNLDKAFSQVRGKLPQIKLTIGFDCVLRLLEVNQKHLAQQVNEIFKKNRVIGFSTYGEQFDSVHVNQTFTGMVLGDRS